MDGTHKVERLGGGLCGGSRGPGLDRKRDRRGMPEIDKRFDELQYWDYRVVLRKRWSLSFVSVAVSE